jgi:hypothetical protein
MMFLESDYAQANLPGVDINFIRRARLCVDIDLWNQVIDVKFAAVSPHIYNTFASSGMPPCGWIKV